MANTFLPGPGAAPNVAPSLIGPQGMQPARGGGNAAGQMQGGLGSLAQALMLAKMRQGKSPITTNGNFTGTVGQGTGMADMAAQPPMPGMVA